MANNHCKECGCACNKCVSSDHDVHLHVEIENLKQRLVERDNHIVTMETNFLNEANKFPNGELGALREELLTWQDKYKRLYEAHRRVQRVNQGLEDKLLKLVDVCETEKNTLTKDVATLSRKLADANYSIKKLTEDNERYKSDVALAIQFLQCKQTNYVSQKFDSLPNEVQAHVSTYMSNKRKPEERKMPSEVKSIKVPIPTFPPTAMVYSVPKSPNPERKCEKDIESAAVDIVSAAIMAKVLEERERERSCMKHCDTCTCSKHIKIIHQIVHHSIGTQTGPYGNSLCLKCNSSVQQSSLSPMKIVRNVDSVKTKIVPIYTHDSNDLKHIHSHSSNNQNVVISNNVAKVQPNNFLIDKVSLKTSSSLSFEIESIPEITNTNIITEQSINNNGQEINTYQDVVLYENVKEKLIKNKSPKFERGLRNSNVINSNSKNVENNDLDTTTVDIKSANNIHYTSAATKGPRYCSMRLQSGSNNILLDNAHNNIAPVLYTRQSSKTKLEEAVKAHENSNSESCSSEDCKVNSVSSDNSLHNHQRVAAWIQNNIEADVSSSDNSRSDSLKTDHFKANVDMKKYAEMENNVKKFLFGESEFLKTVEIGKLKYQDFNNCGSCVTKEQSKSSHSNSHTETEI